MVVVVVVVAAAEVPLPFDGIRVDLLLDEEDVDDDVAAAAEAEDFDLFRGLHSETGFLAQTGCSLQAQPPVNPLQ